MAWFNFGGEDIGAELRTIRQLLEAQNRIDMATNDELAQINASLTEASTEIPAKLDELLAQIGDQADSALVAQIKAQAAALANIVPNPEPPVEEPETPAEPEEPETPVEEAPAEPAPEEPTA